MESLYKERSELIKELRVNNYFVQAWLDQDMPESWALNALRCAEKVKDLTVKMTEINKAIMRKEVYNMREIITQTCGLYIVRCPEGYEAFRSMEDLAANRPVIRLRRTLKELYQDLDEILDSKNWEGGE